MEHRVDVPPCQGARFVAISGVRMQSAAATLACGHQHRHSVFLQNANGGAIQLSKRDISNAACKKGYLGARLSFRRKLGAKLTEKEFFFDLWTQRVYLVSTNQLQESRFAQEILQSGTLVPAQHLGPARQQVEISQHLFIKI